MNVHTPGSDTAARQENGVRVSPAELIGLREESRRLDLTPRGKVLATRSGGHLSRFRGRGMEFDESRIYAPGDDPRNMDWKVTARSGKPHVKLYREERERPVWLLVDLGASMRFGTRSAFKSVAAARAAALLAWAATERGDRVGGLIFDETRHYQQPPAPRTRGLLPLLNALAQPPLAGGDGGHGGLTGAAAHLTRLVRPGSLVFLISDFLDVFGDPAVWLARLAEHSEVVLIHVVDPVEMMAPPAGRYPVSDGVRRAFLDTTRAALRGAYARRFADHAAWMDALARRNRVHRLQLRTDAVPGSVLANGLRPRGNGAAAAGARP